jgi:hypothetical protein
MEIKIMNKIEKKMAVLGMSWLNGNSKKVVIAGTGAAAYWMLDGEGKDYAFNTKSEINGWLDCQIEEKNAAHDCQYPSVEPVQSSSVHKSWMDQMSAQRYS